jgi:hypothetical protein
MTLANKLIESICNERNVIIDNLKEESIEVYKFLQQEFNKGSVVENPVFQFVYRSFYRLDNAGLTAEFKREYFIIMEELRDTPCIDICYIVNRLYDFPRLKGDTSIQFSFSTKMINTINPLYPIYDSEVAKVFGFSTYHIKNKEQKINRYLSQQQIIQTTYKSLLSDHQFHDVLRLFDKKFIGNDLHPVKKIDFIFWSAGKLLNK